jgi:hypothetical protein
LGKPELTKFAREGYEIAGGLDTGDDKPVGAGGSGKKVGTGFYKAQEADSRAKMVEALQARNKNDRRNSLVLEGQELARTLLLMRDSRGKACTELRTLKRELPDVDEYDAHEDVVYYKEAKHDCDQEIDNLKEEVAKTNRAIAAATVA